MIRFRLFSVTSQLSSCAASATVTSAAVHHRLRLISTGSNSHHEETQKDRQEVDDSGGLLARLSASVEAAAAAAAGATVKQQKKQREQQQQQQPLGAKRETKKRVKKKKHANVSNLNAVKQLGINLDARIQSLLVEEVGTTDRLSHVQLQTAATPLDPAAPEIRTNRRNSAHKIVKADSYNDAEVTCSEKYDEEESKANMIKFSANITSWQVIPAAASLLLTEDDFFHRGSAQTATLIKEQEEAEQEVEKPSGTSFIEMQSAERGEEAANDEEEHNLFLLKRMVQRWNDLSAGHQLELVRSLNLTGGTGKRDEKHRNVFLQMLYVPFSAETHSSESRSPSPTDINTRKKGSRGSSSTSTGAITPPTAGSSSTTAPSSSVSPPNTTAFRHLYSQITPLVRQLDPKVLRMLIPNERFKTDSCKSKLKLPSLFRQHQRELNGVLKAAAKKCAARLKEHDTFGRAVFLCLVCNEREAVKRSITDILFQDEPQPQAQQDDKGPHDATTCDDGHNASQQKQKQKRKEEEEELCDGPLRVGAWGILRDDLTADDVVDAVNSYIEHSRGLKLYQQQQSYTSLANVLVAERMWMQCMTPEQRLLFYHGAMQAVHRHPRGMKYVFGKMAVPRRALDIDIESESSSSSSPEEVEHLSINVSHKFYRPVSAYAFFLKDALYGKTAASSIDGGGYVEPRKMTGGDGVTCNGAAARNWLVHMSERWHELPEYHRKHIHRKAYNHNQYRLKLAKQRQLDFIQEQKLQLRRLQRNSMQSNSHSSTTANEAIASHHQSKKTTTEKSTCDITAITFKSLLHVWRDQTHNHSLNHLHTEKQIKHKIRSVHLPPAPASVAIEGRGSNMNEYRDSVLLAAATEMSQNEALAAVTALSDAASPHLESASLALEASPSSVNEAQESEQTYDEFGMENDESHQQEEEEVQEEEFAFVSSSSTRTRHQKQHKDKEQRHMARTSNSVLGAALKRHDQSVTEAAVNDVQTSSSSTDNHRTSSSATTPGRNTLINILANKVQSMLNKHDVL